MKISTSELDEKGYRFLEKMSHENLVQFMTPYLSKFNIATITFVAVSLSFLGGFIFLMIKSIVNDTIGVVIGFFIFGWITAYTLIPLHEFIHGLGYRAVGAKKVSCDVNFKKFIFLTVADKFVTNKTEFVIVALAPFTITTILITPLLFIGNSNWQVFFIGMLFTHTVCCIGDFGLVSYFLTNNKEEIVTFDDKDLKETFFYVKSLRMKTDWVLDNVAGKNSL